MTIATTRALCKQVRLAAAADDPAALGTVLNLIEKQRTHMAGLAEVARAFIDCYLSSYSNDAGSPSLDVLQRLARAVDAFEEMVS